MNTKVALVQLEVSDTTSPVHREGRVIELVHEAAGAGASFVMLPELWTVGAFNTDAMTDPARGDIGKFENFASVLAKGTGVWLHAGSDIEVDEAGHRYNTAVLVDPDGTVVGRYRKQYLWGGEEGEAAVLTAGAGSLLLQTPLGATGVTTCYELRFPELYRDLVDHGAQAYLVVAGWPQARVEHWRTLLRARAIENQAWVLGVNCVGSHSGAQMGGYSAVVSPRGEVLAEGSPDAEQILYAEVDLAAVNEWRARFGWLADRKSCC